MTPGHVADLPSRVRHESGVATPEENLTTTSTPFLTLNTEREVQGPLVTFSPYRIAGNNLKKKNKEHNIECHEIKIISKISSTTLKVAHNLESDASCDSSSNRTSNCIQCTHTLCVQNTWRVKSKLVHVKHSKSSSLRDVSIRFHHFIRGVRSSTVQSPATSTKSFQTKSTGAFLLVWQSQGESQGDLWGIR